MPQHEVASSVRRFVGGSLILLALLFNKWSLETAVVPDGRIESVAYNLVLLLAQLLVIGVGVLIWSRGSSRVVSGVLAVLSVAISLLALEGLFRVLDIRAEYPADVEIQFAGPHEREPHALIPLAERRFVFPSNPMNYFDSGNVIDHIHNSAGWRDVEHTVLKPPGTFRILGLGDSFLYGVGVRYDDIVLTKLGGLLEHLHPGVSLETINTGVPGMGTADQRDLLRDRGLDYNPDLVILFYVLNDVYDGEKPAYLPQLVHLPKQDMGYSYLWNWGRMRFYRSYNARQLRKRTNEAVLKEVPNWQLSQRALSEIRALSAEHAAQLLVVIFPRFYNLDGDYPFEIVHEAVRKHCESVGISVLDLLPSYREYHGPELWVHPTDQHPNHIAHEIAADATYDYLRKHPHLIRGLNRTTLSGESAQPSGKDTLSRPNT